VNAYGPHVDKGSCLFEEAGVYFVATNHKEFGHASWNFPQGSAMLDPWRFVPKREGIEIIHIGKKALS